MSRFFSDKYKSLVPYVPGEQPTDMKYVKLNTNESPFPLSEKALKAAEEALQRLELYPDPECRELKKLFAEVYGITPGQVVFGNGSDEVLNFAFMAFCDEKHPAAFPDITYGFYPVFAALNNVPYEEIPLNEDLTVNVGDYIGIHKTVFIANPNAPTGIFLPLSDIERILISNPDSVVVVDEAYVDFGGESSVSLIPKYDNLLVVQTFSKSRSLAGGRLGMAMGQESLIQDLETLRFSTNPYNINRVTMAAGIGALKDEDLMQAHAEIIMKTRAYTEEQLKKLGFEMTSSCTNFVFAKCSWISGKDLYEKLKEKGVLIRHFNIERIQDHNRITIGSMEQMKILMEKITEIREEMA